MVFNGILCFITYGTNKCLLSYLVPLDCINRLFFSDLFIVSIFPEAGWMYFNTYFPDDN